MVGAFRSEKGRVMELQRWEAERCRWSTYCVVRSEDAAVNAGRALAEHDKLGYRVVRRSDGKVAAVVWYRAPKTPPLYSGRAIRSAVARATNREVLGG